MNAADQSLSLASLKTLASVVNLVRQYFPAASPNFTPWRDDPQTRMWCEEETLDLAFDFPGWTPKLECRSLLVQLRLKDVQHETTPRLLGVIMRGMTFDGERWRLVTIGDWHPTGTHLPQQAEITVLQEICQELFELFSNKL